MNKNHVWYILIVITLFFLGLALFPPKISPEQNKVNLYRYCISERDNLADCSKILDWDLRDSEYAIGYCKGIDSKSVGYTEIDESKAPDYYRIRCSYRERGWTWYKYFPAKNLDK